MSIGIGLLIYLINLFLLYKFKSIGKQLYLILFIVFMVLILLSPPSAMDPLLYTLDGLGMANSGAILVFLYFTPIKKEFDKCRKNQEPHRKLKKEGLEHIVPYDAGTTILTNSKKEEKKWEVIDVWRDSINHGLKRRFQKTKIILQGGIDDVWFNTKTKELIVVDYKSQASPKEVSQDTYFEKGYRESYKTQLDFYAYLMKGMDDLKYEISSDGYLYVVNGLDVEEGFNAKIKFSETLIHHEIKTDYLDDEIQNMIDVINSTNVPQGNKSCKNCAYARQRSKTDTL